MASSENVTNEKSSDFDDGVYDPDLEARLYAEIYYSNETYVPKDDSSNTNITQISTCVTNESVNSSSEKNNSTIENENNDKNRIEETSKNIWTSEEFNRNVRRDAVKNRRLLTHEGLWSSPTEPKKSVSNIPVESPKSVTQSINTRDVTPIFQTPKKLNDQRKSKNSTESNVEKILPVKNKSVTQSINPTIDVTPIAPIFSTPKKSNEQRKSKNSTDSNIEKNSPLKNKTPKKNRNRTNAEIAERGKYKVISKKKKLKMIQMNSEPVNISSDSDDSILEVPVPPKAPPVIIQLPDSEDDSEKSAETVKKKKDKAIKSPETNRSRDSVENSPEERSNTRNSEEFVEPACPDNNGLILNCTEIQRGASSLDEIRKMRETVVASVHTHSDDSMTESEANNWHSIADGQSDVARDEEIASNDTENSLIWNQLRQENVTPIEALPGTSSEITNSIDATEPLSTPTRKRPKEPSTSTISTDLNAPAIPEKRSKQSTEQSFTEYFFKPMSKKLQSFYNNPWGGENMNLYDIQSRMPKNPRCWTILDADLQGPTSKRRRACPRCKTDSHFGKRCPEKPRAPCCYMCGTKGHTESRCPHTMCLTCGRKYATYRPTCGFCSRLRCDMCNGFGHGSPNCPDLWRRYHNTISETLPIAPRQPFDVMKAPQLLTCCNCAKRGHDVTMCKQLRWSQHFPTPIYVSSYTRGPAYEWFNDRNDFTEDVLIDDAPMHPNIITNPVVLPPHEPRQEFDNARTAPSQRIDVAEEIHIPVAEEPSIILKVGDFDWIEDSNSHKISRRLDEMPNLHLDGLLSGRLVPPFLSEWQKLFEFRIGITRNSSNIILMVLEARTKALTEILDKIMMQWLMRNDDDKVHLEYGDVLPYDNRPELSKILKAKIVQLKLFKRKLKPEIFLEKNGFHRKNKRRLTYNDIIKFEPKRRKLLVTVLYSRWLVKGATEIVQSFRQLVGRSRLRMIKQLSLEEYLNIIYLNNVMFTPYMNDELLSAFNKMLAESMQTKKATSQVVSLETESKQPDKATPQVVSLETESNQPEKVTPQVVSLETESINDCNVPENNFSAYSSPLGTENPEEITIVEDRIGGDDETSRIPSVFGLAETSNTNNENPVVINEKWKAPFKRVGVVTRNRSKLLNEKRPFARMNNETNQGLLILLTKRNRKFYKNAAKDVIRLANSSNLPHLQKLAKVMKYKLGNGKATTEDVHMLQNAIEKSTNRKYQPPKPQSKPSRQSLLNNYEKTHQDFTNTHKNVTTIL